jgi:hypothetical protein
MVPLKLVRGHVQMHVPLTKFSAEDVAAQLVAGYGSDALPLAVRRADKVFEEGAVIEFVNWCLVIGVLEELVHVNQMTRRQQV